MKDNSKKVLELALSLACVDITFNKKLDKKITNEKRIQNIRDMANCYIETAKRNLLEFIP
jgi:hypothetical protein